MAQEAILDSWHGQTAVLGTKHHKEQVIGPVLAEAFGLTLTVPEAFDTDQFGTFTRDITRVGTPYEVAKRKAQTAAKQTGHTLALASEGSFGTHPSIPFLPYHTEVVVLLDLAHGIELAGYHTDSQLRAEGKVVHSVAEAIETAQSWGFPAQGVIVRQSEHSTRNIHKEIRTLDQLTTATQQLLGRWFRSSIFLETDMRAHRCPQRMDTIKRAAENLVERAEQLCPQCGTPGFVVQETTLGLPCGYCGEPTDQPQGLVYRCQRCHYSHSERVAGTSADPGYCNRCNP